MTIFDFMDKHWFLAFLIICFTYGLIIRIVRLPTLMKNGWPPKHCDADGDIMEND